MDAAAGGAAASVRFLGARADYWRLLTRGAVLLMLTLGIYRFWLTTDVRRFLWANTEIAGEALEYTGTALELLIGFLAAIALLIPVYAGFFVAALDLGPLGQVSGVLGFLALFVLGQFAIYRARRYRLTRTVYRGLRFHQEGSAWGYALRAVLWWAATLVTLGLAYPFQLASLERFKMRHTFYGDLAGHFAGSGFGLLLRGLPMWLLVMGPLVLALGAFVEGVNWTALAEALGHGGGKEVMARVEGGNPGLGGVIVFSLLMVATAVTAAALLYPVFQALVLRWWSSGLRFGALEVRSSLRTAQVYAAYMRFLGWALVFSLALAVAGIVALVIADRFGEVVVTGVGLIGYVIAALGYSTIYRATVMLSLWQLGMELLQLSGLSTLDTVKARGQASSPLGEGLADALNVGGF